MQFGTPAKDVVESSGNYLRSFGAGDTKVRFYEDIPEWIAYWEHFLGKKSFPCTGDRNSCPGCVHEDEKVRKASRRYAANVLLVDRGVVLPFKLPSTVKKRCEARAARNDGSITTRDYTVIKTGQNLDTEYDVEQEEKYEVDWDKYEESLSDLQDILRESFEEVWGEGSAEEYFAKASRAGDKPAATVQKRRNETVDDQLDRWAEEGKTKPKTTRTKKAEPEVEPEEDEVKGEDIEIDEDTLRSMGLIDLIALADKGGVDIKGLSSADEIIARILDEPPY